MKKEKVTIYKKVKNYTFKKTKNEVCNISNWIELQALMKTHKNGLFLNPKCKNIDNRKMMDIHYKELFDEVLTYQKNN